MREQKKKLAAYNSKRLAKWFIRSYNIYEILGLKSLVNIFGATLKQFFHVITLYVCVRERD